VSYFELHFSNSLELNMLKDLNDRAECLSEDEQLVVDVEFRLVLNYCTALK